MNSPETTVNGRTSAVTLPDVPKMTFARALRHGVHSMIRDPLLVLIMTGVGFSSALHIQMAAMGFHGLIGTLIMACMAVACISCLVTLLLRGSQVVTVRMIMGMAQIMVIAHLILIFPPAGSGNVHRHNTVTSADDPIRGGLAHGSFLVVIAVELLVAATAAVWIRNKRTMNEWPNSASGAPHPGPFTEPELIRR
jgi:hypothetical protein